MKRRVLFVPFFVLVLSCAPCLRAQIFDQVPQKGSSVFGGGGAYYNFSSGSGCELKVSIWGFVGNPGRYNLPCETNLMELLSFAGGPREGAFLDKILIIRRGGPEKQIEIKEGFTIDLQKYLKVTHVGSAAIDLLLFPGDLVIVQGEVVERYSLISYLQIFVVITSAVTAFVAVYNLLKPN